MFNNTKAQKEIIVSLSKFLAEKHNKKLDSFDAYLYTFVYDLVKKEENTIVPNEVLWITIRSLPGSEIPNKPLSYNTEDFGIISMARVTKTCEDKFGCKKTWWTAKISCIWQKYNPKFKTNYSAIEEIKIMGNDATNTFNTLWKGVNRNGSHKEKFKIKDMAENMKDQDEDDGSEKKIQALL